MTVLYLLNTLRLALINISLNTLQPRYNDVNTQLSYKLYALGHVHIIC